MPYPWPQIRIPNRLQNEEVLCYSPFGPSSDVLSPGFGFPCDISGLVPTYVASSSGEEFGKRSKELYFFCSFIFYTFILFSHLKHTFSWVSLFFILILMVLAYTISASIASSSSPRSSLHGPQIGHSFLRSLQTQNTTWINRTSIFFIRSSSILFRTWYRTLNLFLSVLWWWKDVKRIPIVWWSSQPPAILSLGDRLANLPGVKAMGRSCRGKALLKMLKMVKKKMMITVKGR